MLCQGYLDGSPFSPSEAFTKMTFCGLDTVPGVGEVGTGRTDETPELSLVEET